MKAEQLDNLEEIATCGNANDLRILIWNWKNLTLIKKICSVHTGHISGLANLGGKYLASCSYDKFLKIWDLEK